VRRAFLILPFALGLGLLAAGCGGSTNDSAATDTTSTAAESGCTNATKPAPRKDGGAKAPKERLDPEKTYALVFATNCGSFTVTLDLVTAPATSSSLVSLAKSGFFDNTIFHRIVPGFVIQGGDPTQTGFGGPGYKTVDKPPVGSTYTKGVVAMAKNGAEPAGTAGSQFFIVTGDDAGLPADYAIVGKVTSGVDTVERIGRLGDPDSEQPTQPIVIESVKAEEQ
jgi:peptidyl-prolyl cis-trans isomerase B (cyclophilin B)